MEKNNINENGIIAAVTGQTTLGELLDYLGVGGRGSKIPTPKKLFEEGGAPVIETPCCKVFANGYAIYDNGSGRTVVWLPYCKSFTFYFDKQKDSEKENSIPETIGLPDEELVDEPWVYAVTLIGEHRVEMNSMNHAGSRTGTKDFNSDDSGDKSCNAGKAAGGAEDDGRFWQGERFGEDPLAAYVRKEEEREKLMKMTLKQREAFILYHIYGFKQREIADLIGISQKAVDYRLGGAEGHIRKIC